MFITSGKALNEIKINSYENHLTDNIARAQIGKWGSFFMLDLL